MKYVKQLLMILLFSFLGEIMKYMIPLPVPASIYGLILLFSALEFHIIKLEAVHSTGKFLIEIMPLMFIPAGAGLMNSWEALRPVCIPVIVIMVISTIAVMAVSGRVTQAVILRKNVDNGEKGGMSTHTLSKEKEIGGEDEYISK